MAVRNQLNSVRTKNTSPAVSTQTELLDSPATP